MRLVIYTHSFAPQLGGVETIVMALARGLAGRRGTSEPIEVVVGTETPRGNMDDRSLPFRVIRRPSLPQLLQLLREGDLIHLAGPALVPLGLCALLRKPVVIEHHGYQAICPNGLLLYEPTKTVCPGHFMASRHRECLRCNAGEGWLRSLRMWALTFPRRWLCQHVAAHVMPTDRLASQLRLSPAVTIHHGVEPGRNNRRGGEQSLPATFVFVGRLVSAKGVRVLLEAAARLRGQGHAFELKIIGEGPERTPLEAMASQYGLEGSVRFPGYLPSEELEEALHSAWAVVVPSLAGEVFGLVAAEQMMRGRLVIAADIGGLGEVVGDAGLKFKPGDVDGLCDCMRRVLDHPEIVGEYGAKARERAQKLFRCERMVEEHRQLYRELTGAR